MLDVFRRSTGSWMAKAVLILVALTFVAWGGYSYTSRNQTNMARVGDTYISISEYEQVYRNLRDNYRRQFGGNISEEMLKTLRLDQMALDMMIQRTLILDAAQKMGLSAVPQEIQQQIAQIPAFQIDGKFNHGRYVAILQQSRMSPEMFEHQVAQDIAASKVESFIKRRAVVTKQEVDAEYAFSFNQIQLAFVQFDPKSYEDKVTVDEAALKTFYESRKDSYKSPEKREILYALFTPDAYMGEVKVSDEEIKQYYDERIERYSHDEEVKARHILFPVKEDAPEAEVEKVKAEAQKVLEQIRQGADFTDMAEKHSGDPGSAKTGGDLGYFSRGRMVPAFSEAAFGLKPGEVSDLVRTQFGFHIIKVEDHRPERVETLEQVKGDIEKEIKEERAREIAYSRAVNFDDSAFASKDIRKAAETHKKEVLGAGVLVERTGNLQGVPGANRQIMEKLFGLPEKDFSGVLELPNGFLVAQVNDVQESEILPFEVAKDQVEKDYRADRGRELAKQKATEIIESARKANSLEEAAQAAGLTARKSEWFSRRVPDKDLTLLRGEGLNAVFQLSTEKPFTDEPLQLGNRFIVAQLLGKREPQGEEQQQRATIEARLLEQKQEMVWNAWLEEVRGKADVEQFREL